MHSRAPSARTSLEVGWGSALGSMGELGSATPALRRQQDQMGSKQPVQLQSVTEQAGEDTATQEAPKGPVFLFRSSHACV